MHWPLFPLTRLSAWINCSAKSPEVQLAAERIRLHALRSDVQAKPNLACKYQQSHCTSVHLMASMVVEQLLVTAGGKKQHMRQTFKKVHLKGSSGSLCFHTGRKPLICTYLSVMSERTLQLCLLLLTSFCCTLIWIKKMFPCPTHANQLLAAFVS